MEKRPAVSVLIPAYKVTSFIAETLDSVFSQTFRGFETIVINDGCPDSANLERTLAPYQDRIVYLRQQNGGPSAARNTGLAAAAGEYIALLDGDDCWEPQLLERQLALLDREHAALAYSNGRYFGAGPLAGRRMMDCVASEGEATLLALLEQRCTVLNSSVVARRETILRAGGWHPPMRYCEDFDLWLRVAALPAHIVYTKEVLVRNRVRPGSASTSKLSMYQGRLLAYERALERPLNPAEKDAIPRWIRQTQAELALELGREAFAQGDTATSMKRLAEANDVLRNPKLTALIWLLRTAPRLAVWLERQRAAVLPRYRRSA